MAENIESITVSRETVREVHLHNQIVRACRAELALAQRQLADAEREAETAYSAFRTPLEEDGTYEVLSVDAITGVVTRKKRT